MIWVAEVHDATSPQISAFDAIAARGLAGPRRFTSPNTRNPGFTHARDALAGDRTRVPVPAARRAVSVPESQNEMPLPVVCAAPMVVSAGVAVTALLSSVTAPLRARVRPVTVAPVVTVMLASARMFPANDVVVPSVAELPTCQNVLLADAPLMRTTEEALAVVSVLPILKMKTALVLPRASSVRAPVS